jgi:hypothetical protein
MIAWTRVRLRTWGRYCRGNIATGYPTRSAFTRANEGGRGGSDRDMPEDIAEVDRAIAGIPLYSRGILITVYCKPGPLWWKASQVGVKKTTFLRRLLLAETRVDRALSISDVAAS